MRLPGNISVHSIPPPGSGPVLGYILNILSGRFYTVYHIFILWSVCEVPCRTGPEFDSLNGGIFLRLTGTGSTMHQEMSTRVLSERVLL